MNKLLLLLGVSFALGLAGCGNNKPAGAATASGASIAIQGQGGESPTLPSIATLVNEYQVVDYDRDVDYSAFMDYRRNYM